MSLFRCSVDSRSGYLSIKPWIVSPNQVYLSLNWTQLSSCHSWADVDGKQARKTGTSSPLGEVSKLFQFLAGWLELTCQTFAAPCHQLFDHGIDSLNCVLGGLVQCAAVGSGHSLYAVFILLVACWPMYLVICFLYKHKGTVFLFSLLKLIFFFWTEYLGRVSYCQ
jgi:ethanolaminephosphotransferase